MAGRQLLPIFIVLAGVHPVLAEEEAKPTESVEEIWDDEEDEGPLVSIGWGVDYSPEDEGSDDYDFSYAVIPDVSIENLYGFSLSLSEISYDLFGFEDEETGLFFSLTPSIAFSEGRDDDIGSGNNQINNLDEIDEGVDIGGSIGIGYGPLIGEITITQEVADGHGGLQIIPSIGTEFAFLDDRLFLSPSLSAAWADSQYMETFYGVNAAQAADTGLDEFDADAGFRNVSLELGSGYALTESLALVGSVAYTRLVGDAADSPITEGVGGENNQFAIFAGVTYSFDPVDAYETLTSRW